MTTWVAGWNLPGYMPEMEPQEFDTREEAEAFIQAEKEWVAEATADSGDNFTDLYVYWVEPAE